MTLGGDKWIHTSSISDWNYKFQELTFPVQYEDYDHKLKKWNFLNGLPDVNIVIFY